MISKVKEAELKWMYSVYPTHLKRPIKVDFHFDFDKGHAQFLAENGLHAPTVLVDEPSGVSGIADLLEPLAVLSALVGAVVAIIFLFP